jgi:hypothetical protein
MFMYWSVRANTEAAYKTASIKIEGTKCEFGIIQL